MDGFQYFLPLPQWAPAITMMAHWHHSRCACTSECVISHVHPYVSMCDGSRRVLGARLHAFTNEVLLVPSCFFTVLHLGKSQNKLCWSHSKMNARQSLLNPPSCTCKTDRWRSQKWVLPTWWCRIVRIALNPMIPFLWLKLDRHFALKSLNNKIELPKKTEDHMQIAISVSSLGWADVLELSFGWCTRQCL